MKLRSSDSTDVTGQQFVDRFAMMFTALMAHTKELQQPPRCPSCDNGGKLTDFSDEEAARISQFAHYVAAATCSVFHQLKVVGIVVEGQSAALDPFDETRPH